MTSVSENRKIDLQNPAACAWENLQLKLGSVGDIDSKGNHKGLPLPVSNGLIPAIIQDVKTRKVLMQGYFNAEAWQKTLETGQVTFYSRSKQRLWTKGETSGNFLLLQSAALDCDRDAFLLQVNPVGAVCHTGTDTCWGESNASDFSLIQLEKIILERRNGPESSSYTQSLFKKGIPKIAQKVGEEAVETVIEALLDDREKFLGESADLMYHFLVLLAAKGVSLSEVETVLEERHTQGR
jgi:phosphoribosyl-AMP cyclohydrolase / phosphoribosyl-ATP pyrophosphohydrolase